ASNKDVEQGRKPRCKHAGHPLRLSNTLCEEPGIGRLHEGGTLIAPDELAVTAADRGTVSRQTSGVARDDRTRGGADRRLLVSLQCRHATDHQLGPRLGVRDPFTGDAARVALRAVEARLPQTRCTRGSKSAARSEMERFDANALDSEQHGPREVRPQATDAGPGRRSFAGVEVALAARIEDPIVLDMEPGERPAIRRLP